MWPSWPSFRGVPFFDSFLVTLFEGKSSKMDLKWEGAFFPPPTLSSPLGLSPSSLTLKGTPLYRNLQLLSVNYEAFRNEEAPPPQTPPEAGF